MKKYVKILKIRRSMIMMSMTPNGKEESFSNFWEGSLSNWYSRKRIEFRMKIFVSRNRSGKFSQMLFLIVCSIH